MRINKNKTALYLYAALLLIFGVFKFYGGINAVISTIEYNWYCVESFKLTHYFPMNLVPFRTIIGYLKDFPGETAVVNLFAYIVLFSPLGFLLPFAYQKFTSLKRFLVTACIIAVCCEVLQLITFTGTLDIDDCILAVCGCLIGYTVYHVFNGKHEQK